MKEVIELIDSGAIDPQFGFELIAALKASDDEKDEDTLHQEHVDREVEEHYLLSENDPITGAILHSEE